jgi:CRP-like cAMP-binding protein
MHLTIRQVLELPLFSHFRAVPHKLKSLMSVADILSYDEGDTILNEGEDDGGALYTVVKGSVLITKIIDAETKRAKALATLNAGEFFGEMSLFDNSPRSASVIAREDCVVIRIGKSDYLDLVLNHVDVAAQLLFSVIQVLSERLRAMNSELVILYDTGKIISKCSDIKEMCNSIITRLCSSAAVPSGFIISFNELNGRYEVAGKYGEYSCGDDFFHNLLSRISLHKTSIFYRDNLSHTSDSEWIHQLIAIPLVKGSFLFGAVVLCQVSHDFSESFFHLAEGVARQIGSAVENAKNREEEKARQLYRNNKRRV